MRRKDPFLVLPDYRENLVLELLPGIPASGAVPDTSENNNNAARTGCTRENGGARIPVLDFSTDGDRLQIPFHSSLNIGSGSYTIIAWLKCDYPTGERGIFYYTRGSSNACYFKLELDTSGTHKRFYGYIMTDDEEQELEIYGGVLPDDEWVMVVLQVNAGVNIKGYLYTLDQERMAAGSANFSGTITTNEDVYIGGGKYDDDYQFEGQIAMIRNYNVVLTELQLKNIYQYTRRHIIGISPKI